MPTESYGTRWQSFENGKKSPLPIWRGKPYLARQAYNRNFPLIQPKGKSLGGAVRLAFAACKNLLILVLAALVGHGTAGFASALARALALAATAMGKRLTQTGFGNRFDMFHVNSLHVYKLTYRLYNKMRSMTMAAGNFRET